MNRNHPMRNLLPELEREKIVRLSMEVLRSTDGEEAIKYLKSEKRHFTDDDIAYSIDNFRIGYMPEEVLNPYGDPHEFAGRLIMPLYDQYNRLTILSSRDWKADSFMPFFHESFIKTNYLYGLNVAKKDIISSKRALVVEGEFDTQFLHARGFKNAVGCMSSTLNLGQIALLSRYCKEIFVVFDGDDPGKKALNKVLGLEKDYNFNVYNIEIIPVVLPPAKDPDDFLHENGAANFSKILEEAKKNKNQTMEDFFK